MSAFPETSDGQPPGAAPVLPVPLYSIGYGARTLQEFLDVLHAHQIEFVIDVRTAPHSKFKPEFSREALEIALKERGLRYVFMGDCLGGQPRDPQCYTEGKVDYTRLKTQPFFQNGVERLRAAHQQQIRAALMCSEGRPEQCHRSKLIGEALAAAGVPIEHIDDDGRLRSHREVIERLTGGQLELFGQPEFHSRKRYQADGTDLTVRSDQPDPAHPCR